MALAAPDLIYGTANEFLNGGPLQNVLQKLIQARYVISSDQLVSILDDAIAVKGTSDGVGLSVTTAALEFRHELEARPRRSSISLPSRSLRPSPRRRHGS